MGETPYVVTLRACARALCNGGDNPMILLTRYVYMCAQNRVQYGAREVCSSRFTFNGAAHTPRHHVGSCTWKAHA